MTKNKAVQTKDVPSTPEIELKILESEFVRVEEALKRKREQLAPQSEKGRRAGHCERCPEPLDRNSVRYCTEHLAFMDAFTLGDDEDDERAVRAAALLLDWSASDGMEVVNAQLALGISKALCRAADNMARTQQHFEWLKERTSNVD